MRPHLLTLTAFGSFPGTERVDFDALAEAGLFLVHGPTGAGKTTLLDALCYALYGQVPGQRNSARSLRCDHAPAHVGPSVVLDVSIRGRRLRIERSPVWSRPKLRGSGFTEEKAKVIVSEQVGGAWSGLTTRADEAGDLIGGLLGMNCEQFCQVAMLPQGDFARFLRADGDERRRLLERLFTVKVFTQAESWLAEQRKLTWRAQQELRQQVDFAVRRIEEAAGEELLAGSAGDAADQGHRAAGPSGGLGLDLDPARGSGRDLVPVGGPGGDLVPAKGSGVDLVPAGGSGQELEWSRALHEAAVAAATRAAEAAASAERALRATRLSFDQATTLADRRRRHAEALTLRRTLDERAGERADLVAILDEAARADRVTPLIVAARQRAEALTKSRTLATDALARARRLLSTTTTTETTRRRTPAEPEPEPDGPTERPEPRESAERPERHGTADRTEDLGPTGRAEDLGPTGRAEDLGLAGRSELRGPTERPEGFGADRSAGPSGPLDAVRLAELERDRQHEIARLSELLTEEARLLVVRRDLSRAEAELAELTTADLATAEQLAVLPERLRQVEESLAGARLDTARIPAVEAVVAAARDLIGAERALINLAAELETLAEREAEVAARDAELPERVAMTTARLSEVRAEAAAVPAARAAVGAAAAALETAVRRESLTAELESAVAALQVLVDQAQESRERWLDIRQARVEGMAAELARELAEGEPCSVCGSEAHPSPAAPAASAPSADDERAAEAAHEEALAAREAAEVAVASLRSRLGEAAGELDPGQAEEALRLAEEELARLEAVAEQEPSLLAELDRVEAERERVREQAREVGEALAAHRTHRAQLLAERSRLLTRLNAGSEASHPLDAGDGASHPGDVGHEAAHPLDAGDDAAARLGGEGGASYPLGSEGRVSGGEGPDLSEGRRLLAVAELELSGLRRSAARLPDLSAEAERLGAQRLRLEEESRRVTARLAACRTRHEELSADAGRLTAKLDSARGDDPTLTARLSRLGDEAELLREALDATQEAGTAAAEHRKAVEEAESAARDAGFDSVADAREAVRPQSDREEMAGRLRELDAQHAAVTSTLADPELAAAARQPAPDLDRLAAELQQAEAEHTARASERDRAEQRQRRLRTLHTELESCLGQWVPAAERHKLAERLAALANGTSGDNQWSMSLSSFVLGERLRQVVEAANERLDHMSGSRYQLQHDLRKTAGARGRAGGGLGLRVADGWTGVDRDPATLSGGESFITSLALALGLADVVAAESGGAEIGTLFVDEGFGTLDEDTLDGVLDILDGLRDGGRAVGIVSHVAELRTRIPAQLRVSKTRTGSTVSVTTPG